MDGPAIEQSFYRDAVAPSTEHQNSDSRVGSVGINHGQNITSRVRLLYGEWQVN